MSDSNTVATSIPIDVVETADPNGVANGVSPTQSPRVFVSASPSDDELAESESIRDLLATLRQKTEEIDELRRALDKASETPNSEVDNGSLETVKKQYEVKLKDVMDKARDHARKIALERDEAKRQSEEKDSRIAHYKQLVQSATNQMEVKDARARELESDIQHNLQKIEKLDQQLVAMESHYTKPPLGKQSGLLAVTDQNGVEWVLVTDRWWRKDAFVEPPPEVLQRIELGSIRKLEGRIEELLSEIDSKSSALAEYKKKVELVLQQDRGASSAVSKEDTTSSLQATRKLMKVEQELAQISRTNALLEKQLADSMHSEKLSSNQLTLSKQETDRLLGLVRSGELRITDLESERKLLVENLKGCERKCDELLVKLERVEAEKASVVFHRDVSANSVKEPEPVVDAPMVKRSVSNATVQTDIFTSAAVKTAPSTPEIAAGVIRPPTTWSAVSTTQHDSVAIPLRHQIRELSQQLEKESHDHSLTIAQLSVVKEELRRVEAERKLGSDLTDPVKVEYMRNVARRFIAAAPVNVSDEFEQLIPLVLNFFGLEGEEAVQLVRQRKATASATSASPYRLW